MDIQNSSVDRDGGRIKLPAHFDMENIARYRLPFAKLVVYTTRPGVIVDFSGMTYIDSIGIATLISWERVCKEKGKCLILENCSRSVRAELEMLGVDHLFTFGAVGARSATRQQQ
ncbi:MAG: anti-sigma factor antagonist [Rhodocyclales bacterium GT-UBC]|nr:MAG: anti-sigma factor antagonist [Rhodocyclales bacterium GT-UBC]